MEGAQPKITPRTVELLNGQGTPPQTPWPVVNYNAPPPDFQPTEMVGPDVTELKIALIGTAPSSRGLAPFHDPTWKIWACSPGNMNVLPRVDVWFELHKNLLWPECQAYGVPYLEWLKKQPFPIYMQDQELVPNAINFPKDKLIAEFGRDFFTSSFAWMMALAILEGAKEIALYGIDMASPGEYALQRQSFYFFRREAQRRGIKVTAPHESDIMQPPGLYGYSDVRPFGRKIAARKSELDQRIASAEQRLRDVQQEVTYLKGAREDLEYIQTIWIGVGDQDG